MATQKVDHTITITVQELIDSLEDMPKDARVLFSYDYGDHNHTQVCAGIDTIVEQDVKYSDYHRQFRLLTEEEDNEVSHTVVILM